MVECYTYPLKLYLVMTSLTLSVGPPISLISVQALNVATLMRTALFTIGSWRDALKALHSEADRLLPLADAHRFRRPFLNGGLRGSSFVLVEHADCFIAC